MDNPADTLVSEVEDLDLEPDDSLEEDVPEEDNIRCREHDKKEDDWPFAICHERLCPCAQAVNQYRDLKQEEAIELLEWIIEKEFGFKMPSEVTDIKKFLEIARRKDAKSARVKKSTSTNQIKFKIRCRRNLYTLILQDASKADKIKQSLPPALKVQEIGKKNKKPKKA